MLDHLRWCRGKPQRWSVVTSTSDTSSRPVGDCVELRALRVLRQEPETTGNDERGRGHERSGHESPQLVAALRSPLAPASVARLRPVTRAQGREGLRDRQKRGSHAWLDGLWAGPQMYGRAVAGRLAGAKVDGATARWQPRAADDH